MSQLGAPSTTLLSWEPSWHGQPSSNHPSTLQMHIHTCAQFLQSACFCSAHFGTCGVQHVPWQRRPQATLLRPIGFALCGLDGHS